MNRYKANPSTVPLFEPNENRGFWHSWVLSALFHLLILGILFGTWMLAHESGLGQLRRGGIALAIVPAESAKAEYLIESSLPLENELVTPTDVDSSSQSTPEILNDARLLTEQLESERSKPRSSDNGVGRPISELVDANQMLQSAGEGGFSGSTGLSTDDQKRIEEEQALVASRRPVGEPISISVFGSGTLTGRKFVFVVDRSASMGSGGLGVLAACITELGREIEKLQDYHQFQIVAYNERTTTMAGPRLLSATSDNKRAIQEFLSGLVAVGGTNHEGALMVALGLDPDIIVLITDGGEPELTNDRLSLFRRLVAGKPEVHCLQFGFGSAAKSADHFMIALADQNRGSYRYIDVSRWDKNRK